MYTLQQSCMTSSRAKHRKKAKTDSWITVPGVGDITEEVE